MCDVIIITTTCAFMDADVITTMGDVTTRVHDVINTVMSLIVCDGIDTVSDVITMVCVVILQQMKYLPTYRLSEL